LSFYIWVSTVHPVFLQHIAQQMIFWYIFFFKRLLIFALPQSLSLESLGCIVGIVTKLQTGSNPGRGKKFFLFPKMSMPALGPTQLPVQWVPVFFSCLDLKWMRHEFDTSNPVQKLSMDEAAPLISLFVIMAWSVTALYLQLSALLAIQCSFESGTCRIFKF
jgi:hypothetical protein